MSLTRRWSPAIDLNDSLKSVGPSKNNLRKLNVSTMLILIVLSLFISAVYYYLFYYSNSQRETDFFKCEKIRNYKEIWQPPTEWKPSSKLKPPRWCTWKKNYNVRNIAILDLIGTGFFRGVHITCGVICGSNISVFPYFHLFSYVLTCFWLGIYSKSANCWSSSEILRQSHFFDWEATREQND